MTPQEQCAAANTLDAQAVRRARQSSWSGGRRHSDADHLAERQRLVAFWRACAETNRSYIPHNGCWWPYHSRSFRFMNMPSVRRRLDARDTAWNDQYQAELRNYARRGEAKKADMAAAKARAMSPQVELFGGATA